MSLPIGQQRILEEIEGSLHDSDPRLMSLFVIFGRLVHGEAMPRVEDIRGRPVADRLASAGWFARRIWRRPARRMRAIFVLPTALAAMVCAVMFTVTFQSTPRSAPNRARTASELVVKPPRGCRLTVLRVSAYGC